jgi:hypothetical protein
MFNRLGDRVTVTGGPAIKVTIVVAGTILPVGDLAVAVM